MKKLMLSTAIMAGLIVTGSGVVMAQDTTNGMFRAAADPMNIRASEFIGMRVYASEAPIDADAYDGTQADWADIGEVNDVILSRDGKVDAVLVDIGGFLGIGEGQVAVGMESVRFVADGSTADNANDFFLVMSAAKADFEAAPDYMLGDDSMMDDGTVADTADTTTEMTREPTARDGFVVAEADFLTSEKLTGASVYDANDDLIGEIGDLVLADDGTANQAIIDVGGFLGMGEKPVALDMTQIDILRQQDGDEVRVYLPMTKEQLESLPAFEG